MSVNLIKYRLGELIVQRREKNNNYDVPIRGVSKEGFINPKQQDADTSIYNVFYKNDFVFNPARMELNSIALNLEYEKALCSSLYEIFYIKDESILLPEFLNLHLKNENFTRFCDFIGSGSAREYCRFANISEYEINIPPIEVQQNVVCANRLIQKRIEINYKLIASLQSTAQTHYKKTFVDGIDKDHLPDGWRVGTIGEYCKKMTSGGTPNRGCNEYWNSRDYRWLKTGEVHNNVVLDTEEYISKKGLEESSAKLIPQGSITLAMYCANGITGGQVAYLACETTTNQACCNMICKTDLDSAFLYFHLIYYQSVIKRNANGAAQENLSQELIANQPILLFDDDSKKKPFEILLNQLVVVHKEILRLKETKTIILSKIGR